MHKRDRSRMTLPVRLYGLLLLVITAVGWGVAQGAMQTVSIDPLTQHIAPGGTITYTVTMTNSGTLPLFVIGVTDTFHGAKSLLSSFKWHTVPRYLFHGESAQAKLTATAPTDIGDVVTLSNTVTVQYQLAAKRFTINSDPQAVIVDSPLTVAFQSINPGTQVYNPATPVTFRVSAAYPGGQAVQAGAIRWDVDGDGVFDTPLIPFIIDAPVTIPPEFTQVFPGVGTYHVIAEVQDNYGSHGTALTDITVYAGGWLLVNLSATQTGAGSFKMSFLALEEPGDQVVRQGYVRWEVDGSVTLSTPFTYFQDGDGFLDIDSAMTLRNLPPGAYTVKAEVKNVWGSGTDTTQVTVP